jgi:hypothetical protein
MGPTMRRRRISDEEDAYSDTVVNTTDLRFPKTSRRVTDANESIRQMERQANAHQRKLDDFWAKETDKRR